MGLVPMADNSHQVDTMVKYFHQALRRVWVWLFGAWGQSVSGDR